MIRSFAFFRTLTVFFGTFATLAFPATNAPDKKSAAVDEVFSDLTKPGSPGCALAVAREGKILYESGYGLANLEEDVKITPQTAFDIGSTSKQFTAASILLLEKAGKLSIHDDVHKYIPELPDYGRKITILHLLNHTSGLRDYLTLFDLAGINMDSVTTDDDALLFIKRQQALNFNPGEEHLYSNTGFFLLSVIVKRVSGQSLRDFARQNIFAPLAMTHTEYRDDHTSIIPNRALAYEPREKSGGFSLDVSYFEQTGDGAVHTTVEDLLKWDENFYSAKVGGRDFLTEIQERAVLNSGKTISYAKGLYVDEYRGLPTVEHGGSWGGYRAQLLRFPEQRFSVVCLCNLGSASPDRRAHRVADIYLADKMKANEKRAEDRDEDLHRNLAKPSKTLSESELEAFAGSYWSEELGAFYVLRADKGALTWTQITDGAGLPRRKDEKQLQMAGPDDFALTTEPLRFRFRHSADGSVAGFTLDAGRTQGVTFVRRTLRAN